MLTPFTGTDSLTMRRLLHFILLSGYMLGPFVAGCTPVETAPTRRFYLSKPAHTRPTEKTAVAVVFIEDRTMVWMNAAMLRARANDLEGGGCGHVAKSRGAGFFVDSIHAPRGTFTATPYHATFGCFRDEAPIHWHPNLAKNMCELSDDDVTADKAAFPFLLMMCGTGIDSVYAYTVLPSKPATAEGR